MIYLALIVAFMFLLAMVAEPEKWPTRFWDFVKDVKIHHG